MGPYIVTFKISNEGNGLSCYYNQQNAAVINRLKVFSRDGNAFGVIDEMGANTVIRLLGDGTYSLEAYGQKYRLLPDDALTLANPMCKAKFAASTGPYAIALEREVPKRKRLA